jgi:Icc protein
LRVFAVEDTAVQLTWSASREESCVVGVGPFSHVATSAPPVWLHRAGRRPRRLSRLPGGPGTAALGGLAPGCTYDVWVAAGSKRRVVAQVTTLRPPPGRLLSRFASVSDTHIGERAFDTFGLIREGPEPGGPSALVCLEAAIAEAREWGAELVVARGDLTRSSRPEQFALAADTLCGAGMPAIGVLGNHDVHRRPAYGAAICRAHGLAVVEDADAHDLPGCRIVLAHSPMPGNHRGELPDRRIARIAQLCGEAPPGQAGRPGPAAVVLHHPLTARRRWSAYPPGLPEDQSARLAAALRTANPAVLVLAGHRHRNRRNQVGGITVAELGSTKDYPGAWAGYAVHEGGIRQVVRRVAAPAALAWTEATGRAVAGQWARWSPGTVEDRCFVQLW